MKNHYIKISLNENNEFRAKANIIIPSINVLDVNDVIVKIDTGCPYTSFPIKNLGISDEKAFAYKQKDSNDSSVRKSISFGVNDSKEKRDNDKKLFKEQKFMQLTSVSFKHSDVKLKIMDVSIEIDSVMLSYDRTGNILIGMDIMKDWDIHISTITNPDLEEMGKTIFLACPRDSINAEYISELKRLFDIDFSSAIAKNKKNYEKTIEE